MASDSFTCPQGGKWYVCSAGSKFIGCCTANPCSIGCAQGDIRQAGFNATLHGKIPDASCDSASEFYTCAAGNTFWGCCKSNPCLDSPTCPPGDLVPAFLGRPDSTDYYAPSPSNTDSSKSESKGSNTGAVVGGVVGGVAVLAILIGALIFFLCRRRKQKRTQHATVPPHVSSAPTAEKGFTPSDHIVDAMSPPPTYAATHSSTDHFATPAKHANSPYMPPHSPYSPHHPSQQWAHNAAEPQELPAEITPGAAINTNRYSELPAMPPSPHETRYAELSAIKTARGSIEEPEPTRGAGNGEGVVERGESSSHAR